VSALSELPESKRLEQALFDHISMTFQFAVDAVHEVDERRNLVPV
jgi:hypothetical protein